MNNNFKSISISDKTFIENIISKYHNLSCEYSFPNLFIWQDVYHTKWTLLDDYLIFFYDSEYGILMPLPNPPPQKLLQIIQKLNLDPQKIIIAHPQDDYLQKYPNLIELFTIEKSEAHSDYVHLKEKLISLRGEKLAKKKNLIKQFRDLHPDYKVLKISPEIFKQCLCLAEQSNNKASHSNISITNEIHAIKIAFENFHQLDLHGIAIFANKSLAAFSVFSFQNSQTAIIHFEKSDKMIKGAAQTIVWETAKALPENIIYINREHDLGVPGLQHSKRSYAPDLMLAGLILKAKNYLL